MLTIHAISDRTITLGREGENLARQVAFDISEWRSSYGDGVVSLIAQRHGDDEPYPCTVTVDGSSVTWLITAADTARNGYGKCELRYTVGDVLVKSAVWQTYTADALGTTSPDAPEPQKAWVDKVLEAGQAAVDASVNPPKVGENGNWFVWSFEAGKYVDTGVAASGGGSGEVLSVNGKVGNVTLEASDVGAVPAPASASVGQTIVVKAVDDSGKPTEWEASDDIMQLRQDLSDFAPAGAAVGQLFRVAAISEDGKYTMEPVDMPSSGVTDVQVDGDSIVDDFVAKLNIAGYQDQNTIIDTGLVRIPNGYGLGFQWNTKSLIINNPSNGLINDRGSNWKAVYYALTVKQIDYAVKVAMCDGKGEAWTDAERIAALLRMGCTADENGFVKWTAQEVAE